MWKKSISSNNSYNWKKIKLNWPIGSFDVNYYYYKSDWVRWNNSLTFNDEQTYSIIRYDHYAWNWDDFVHNYGYKYLYLHGLNVWFCSPATFGCTNKKYGNKLLALDNGDYVFNLADINKSNDKNHPYWINLYKVYDNVFSAYEIKCNAALGFFINEKTKELKVKVQTENYLWSAGAVGRKITINFNLDWFYFIPNHI